MFIEIKPLSERGTGEGGYWDKVRGVYWYAMRGYAEFDFRVKSDELL